MLLIDGRNPRNCPALVIQNLIGNVTPSRAIPETQVRRKS
jgi:hypothetical protein